MNKEFRDALAQNLNWQPWKVAVDAALKWGLDCDDIPEAVEEAYEVGHIWDCLRRWRDEQAEYGRNTYEHLVAGQMKAMGWPAFYTYEENAAFILEAVYGDDE
jgi:hypothetical protein